MAEIVVEDAEGTAGDAGFVMLCFFLKLIPASDFFGGITRGGRVVDFATEDPEPPCAILCFVGMAFALLMPTSEKSIILTFGFAWRSLCAGSVRTVFVVEGPPVEVFIAEVDAPG